MHVFGQWEKARVPGENPQGEHATQKSRTDGGVKLRTF